MFAYNVLNTFMICFFLWQNTLQVEIPEMSGTLHFHVNHSFIWSWMPLFESLLSNTGMKS